MELRNYQNTAIEELRKAVRLGYKRILLVLPTGSGKSIIFGKIISNILENNKKVSWLVHRRNLVKQMKATLIKHFNINPGVIMAGDNYDLDNNVQLCSKDTFSRRLKLGEKWNIDTDILLIDEGHRAIAKSYKDIIDIYSNKIIIGCTATPCRADGRGLGEVYDTIIEVASVKELTDQGYLSPVEYYAPVEVELDGVTVRMNDYAIDELARKMINKKIIGDAVHNWLNLACNENTLVYGVNVKHSIALRDEYIRMGVPAAHLDARHTDDEREEVFNKMERGEIKVICNVGLYQEGMDVPSISCVQIVRPTKSLALYRQMVGRGLRLFDGKKWCRVLDHGNVIDEHGFIDEEIEWTLDGKEMAWKRKIPREKEEKLVKCRVCNKVFKGMNKCPDCGTPLKTFGKRIEAIEAELKKINDEEKEDRIKKRLWFGMFKGYAIKKGYKDGWAFHKYKEKFKEEPGDFRYNTDAIEPNQEFKNYLKHLNIKWAKSKNKQQADKNLKRGGELINEQQSRL